MRAIFETAFDVCYLITAIAIGIIMIVKCKGKKQYLLFGIMAVVLGAGDAFHLVPRAIALCSTGVENYTFELGLGKLITSITMTVFYLLLYYVWRLRYNVQGKHYITITVYALAICRIVLCALPQNQWFSANPPLLWGILRNIPFTLFGILIIVLFFISARQRKDKQFKFMWLTIVLSFAFYIPVVIWASEVPLLGLLMIPKTCAYVWTILIGFFAMRKDNKQDNVEIVQTQENQE